MIALCLACTWERKKISFWELPPQKHINSISNLKSPWDQPCLPPRLLLRHWPPAASTANCGGTGAVAKLPCETVNTAGSSSGWRWRPFQSCSLGWSSHQTTSSMLLLFRLALHVSQNHLQGGLRLLATIPCKGPRLLPQQFQWVPLVLVVHQWLPHPWHWREPPDPDSGFSVYISLYARIVTDEMWQKKM